jgi:hypothetical protein
MFHGPNGDRFLKAANECLDKKGNFAPQWLPQKEAAAKLGITPRYLSMLDKYVPPRLPRVHGQETLYTWPSLAMWFDELEWMKATMKTGGPPANEAFDRRCQINKYMALEYALEALPKEMAPELVGKGVREIEKALREEVKHLMEWAKDAEE